MLSNARIPVVGFVAHSGTGKTTLLRQLIPLLREAGIRVAVIKHTHHDFDIDQPGKDSYVLRKAGTEQMLVASNRRWALMVENSEQQPEPALNALLTQLDQSRLELILVEGFKHESFPKIELQRVELAKPALYVDDADIIAVASDAPLQTQRPITRLDLNQPRQILDFLIARFRLDAHRKP